VVVGSLRRWSVKLVANDDLYTPKWIFDQIGLKFDLDVCASNNKNIVVPADKRYTIEDDGLSSPWFGRVWMNPPFSKPRPWAEKFLAHGNGIALLPLSGNSIWWRNLWNSEAAVVMVKPNTGFINTEGEEKKIMYGISLWAVGEENIQALREFSKVR
jgi:hypothetical protein